MQIFEVKNLCFKYDKYAENKSYIIDDVSFDIDQNDFVAIVGKSGSGKSTLIQHLNGLLKADSGDILYEGKSIYSKDFNLTSLRFKCGIVFQHPEYQLFSETVLEDVEFGALKKGMTKAEAEKKSMEILKYLKIDHLKDEVPFNLSGGEKRKVAFAGVFVMEPDILIFDEPDAGLDSMAKNHFYEMLKDLNENYKKTIIFITHNLDDVIEYANKAIILNEGRVEKIGKPAEIFLDDDLMKRCKLISPYAIEIYKYLKERNIHLDIDKLKFNDLKKELEDVLL